MARIPEPLIQKVREAHDIVDIVSEYVTLRKRGKNHVGLCPFHSEKTPSFSVVQDKQFFYCFGCHTGGDVIKFIMEIEGYTYVESIKYLAEKAGIPLPEVEDTIDDEDEKKKERMKEAHVLSAKLYNHVLIHTKYGENAREYLKQRGISNETIQHYLIGYAPTNRQFLYDFLQRRGFVPDEMVEAGLLIKSEDGQYFDRFINRVQFPIEDQHGRIVAFSGRALGNGKPKYINSPESPIFYKSSLLFNLFKAKQAIRKNGHAILIEGHLDAITLYQAGIENVVASQGTAFTDDMARLIRRYASQVTICYDGDMAGMDSADRAAEILLSAGIDVRIAILPSDQDPDSYVRTYGVDAFRVKILKEALPITAYRIMKLRRGKDLSDSIERARFIEKALEYVAQLSSSIERDHYVGELSTEFHVPIEVLRQEVNKIIRRDLRRDKKRDMSSNIWNNNKNNSSAKIGLQPAYFRAERKLLAMMLKFPDSVDQILEQLGGAFNEPEHLAIAAEIYACHNERVPNIATAVLHRIEDRDLQNIVTSLIMEEMVEPPTDKGIRELILAVLDYPKQKELEALILARQNALEMEDHTTARVLNKQIIELQKQLKSFRYKDK